MTNWKPDKIDFEILDILQRNARTDVARIARRVNKTPHPVHDRIDRLEQEGFIQGYIALIDRARIGKPVLVMVLVKLEKQTKTLLNAFEEMAGRMPEVQFCLHLSGKWDFMLQVTAADPIEYYTFLMERICDQPNVAHVESSFVLKECKRFGPFAFTS